VEKNLSESTALVSWEEHFSLSGKKYWQFLVDFFRKILEKRKLID
jgi:hypothetical protein